MLRSFTLATVIIGMGIALSPTGTATPMVPEFKSCKAAHKAGVYNIPKGDPQYKKKQDPDHNGIACEGHPKEHKGNTDPAPEPVDGELPPAQP